MVRPNNPALMSFNDFVEFPSRRQAVEMQYCRFILLTSFVLAVSVVTEGE